MASLEVRVVGRRECGAARQPETVESIDPSRRGRYPVLYVPGFLRLYVLSAALRRRLRNLDFAVYTLRMPNFNSGDIRWSAKVLLDKVDELRVLSGADRVALIGQGLGGLVARFMVEGLGGAEFLYRLVMLGTPNRGSLTFYLFFPFKAARQMLPRSAFLRNLAEAYRETWGEESPPYYSVCTPLDAAVIPWTSCLLEGAENLRPGWPCTHMGLVRSRAVAALLSVLLEGEADREERRRAEEDQAALRDLNRALEEDPLNDAALLRRAEMLMKWGYYSAALRDLKRLAKLRPDLPELYILAGRAYRHKIKYDDNPLYNQAIRNYTRAISLEPGSAEAYFERGVCYALLNAWGEAVDDWDRALILNRDYYPAYLARGLARRRRGDMGGAEEDFREVLRINPGDRDASRFLSELEGRGNRQLGN
ncbi:tetratricopeptide repeat protein [Candidatus Solincola sp.]|nr:tetratricopeptide repeat protein [Actinomycetota bacterium]MDI7251646.1 tetratricopeptide repeat protein [Actinomycetota bacterium]